MSTTARHTLLGQMFAARLRAALRTESTVEALRRVEAECDWSDAPAVFAELFERAAGAADGAVEVRPA